MKLKSLQAFKYIELFYYMPECALGPGIYAVSFKNEDHKYKKYQSFKVIGFFFILFFT